MNFKRQKLSLSVRATGAFAAYEAIRAVLFRTAPQLEGDLQWLHSSTQFAYGVFPRVSAESGTRGSGSYEQRSFRQF